MSFHRELYSQMIQGVAVAYKTPWASAPLALGPLRFGTIQAQAAKSKNFGGARVKVQGSNVGIGIDVSAIAASGRQLDLGGINPTDLGWTDLGYQEDLPVGVDASVFVPRMPAPGALITWDVNWIRLVVTAGPGGITLDAWAKFKSGE